MPCLALSSFCVTLSTVKSLCCMISDDKETRLIVVGDECKQNEELQNAIQVS